MFGDCKPNMLFSAFFVLIDVKPTFKFTYHNSGGEIAGTKSEIQRAIPRTSQPTTTLQLDGVGLDGYCHTIHTRLYNTLHAIPRTFWPTTILHLGGEKRFVMLFCNIHDNLYHTWPMPYLMLP